MMKLKINYEKLKYSLIPLLFAFLFSNILWSNQNLFQIEGNNYTDQNVILSLLENIPINPDEEYTNDIIKVLNRSELFSDVQVNFLNGQYIIKVNEFPNINRIYFDKNERLDDEDLNMLAYQLDFNTLNSQSINQFIIETKKVYESFGYNNVDIEYSKKVYSETNTVDLYFTINEGNITKINNIFITGNTLILADEIKQIIDSKVKSITNLLANNNYKPMQIERDKISIRNYYKDNGFIDVQVNSKIEYLKTNRVNIYFNIKEGNIYYFSNIDIKDDENILNKITLDLVNSRINLFQNEENIYSIKKVQNLKKDLSSIIIDNGVDFFKLESYEKKEDDNVKILFLLSPVTPKYAKQINIVGNSRTFDNVIRRELEIIEGDAIFENQYQTIRNKLLSLNLFETVNVKEEIISDSEVNLIIEVKEKQTGSFNAGVSVGTLDGFAIVTGLRERNFYGTGRSLDVLLNTSEDRNQFKFVTTDRLSYENDADISYSINYRQDDFSTASSYKLDTFSAGIGIGYKLNNNVVHSVDLEYVLKDYKITNSSSVSNAILQSSGSNMSYLIKNNLAYSTLNPGFISKKGDYLNFNNTIETPTSSSNGFVRNILDLKKYYSKDNNIFSIQSKIGNIISLNNNDILSDDKFSLGGRWLRGFDNYGAGPRNSRTSYVGGNNIIVTKLDYAYEITNNSNFPFYLNIFNDYGIVWENKTKPTQSDNNLRSSAGFGIKYYSPIGPIGFTWGFPLMEEEYDINRMFLFSIGNID